MRCGDAGTLPELAASAGAGGKGATGMAAGRFRAEREDQSAVWSPRDRSDLNLGDLA